VWFFPNRSFMYLLLYVDDMLIASHENVIVVLKVLENQCPYMSHISFSIVVGNLIPDLAHAVSVRTVQILSHKATNNYKYELTTINNISIFVRKNIKNTNMKSIHRDKISHLLQFLKKQNLQSKFELEDPFGDSEELDLS
ncbi:hypothetical protein ACJX0J_034504, partial [Zea mays]